MADYKKYEDLVLKNEKLTEEQYLAGAGKRPDDILLDKVGAARLSAALRNTDRGSVSDRLSSSGLSGTGYEDYLKRLSVSEYETDTDLALGASTLAASENKSAYQKYLSEYGKLQTKISDSFIKSFAEGRDFSEESAYERAVKSGLSRENALYSAVRAVRAAKDSAIEESIAFARMNGLTPYRAMEYAKSLGLDEKEAKKVYDALSTLTDEEKKTVLAIGEAIKANTAVPCTACRYCVDDCPARIAIPAYFSAYNYFYRFGESGRGKARHRYERAAKESGKASECIGCGVCEAHCPQHIDIREKLKEVAKELEV